MTTKAASINLDLKAHWDSMMEYLAKEITRVEITKIIDDFGVIIGITEDETTIYGAISPVGQKTINESIGEYKEGDLVLYLMSEDSFDTEGDGFTTIMNYIEYQNIRYTTEKIKTAYDNGVAVVDKFKCRKTV